MLYEITVPQFIKTLENLQRILAKGAQFAQMKNFEMEVLLNSRLAPDQFHLIRQVQIACDSAKLAAARLKGVEAPIHDDKERSLADLNARIESVVGYLKTFSAVDFNGATEKRITTPRWEGKTLSGLEFIVQHALPNFYFHITTAYAILRHNGVDVGKKDYLGEMPYKK
jgi:hypothetical protein